MNIGIIGCGVIGRAHISAFSGLRDVRVGAVCDVNRDLAKAAAQEYGIARWRDGAEDILSDPSIDALVLALPTGVRTEIALRAFATGKHVLLEKPAAMNTAEIDLMLEKRDGVVVSCCSARYRSVDSAQRATQLIRSGALGTIRSISCRVIDAAQQPPTVPPPSWRLSRELNGGGILVNWGSYDLDFLLGLTDFKLKPVHVLAGTWTVSHPYKSYVAPGSNGETHVSAFVTFSNGARLSYERAEFSASPPHQHWEISGELGTLSLTMAESDDSKVLWTRSHPGSSATTEIICGADEAKRNRWVDTNCKIAANFVAAIRGEARPLTGLEEARVLSVITDAIYASAASAGLVNLEEHRPNRLAEKYQVAESEEPESLFAVSR